MEAPTMYGDDSSFIGTTLILPSFQRVYGVNNGFSNETWPDFVLQSSHGITNDIYTDRF